MKQSKLKGAEVLGFRVVPGNEIHANKTYFTSKLDEGKKIVKQLEPQFIILDVTEKEEPPKSVLTLEIVRDIFREIFSREAESEVQGQGPREEGSGGTDNGLLRAGEGGEEAD